MRRLRDRLAWWRPELMLEAFVAGNLGFLAVDVYVAHSYNEFADAAEWVPFYASITAPILLGVAWILGGGLRRSWRQTPAYLVGIASIIVGIAGLVLHLESQFFEARTLKSLVYAAPFAAPLAYVGLGLLVLLNREQPAATYRHAQWVLLLAAGGYAGNFVLALADHAQNGFFRWTEWLAVGAGAFGMAFLLLSAVRPDRRAIRRATLVVLAGAALVGFAGALLHGRAVLAGTMPSLWENAVYGAPPFAPLLFVDLALLGGIGLWEASRCERRGRAAD